jgi:hypothetical protein
MPWSDRGVLQRTAAADRRVAGPAHEPVARQVRARSWPSRTADEAFGQPYTAYLFMIVGRRARPVMPLVARPRHTALTFGSRKDGGQVASA